MAITAQEAAFSFVERLAKDLKDERLELPAFPDAVLRIQSTLQSPDADANDIVAILSSDPALAATILRTANSAAFSRSSNEITDLRTAITRMGFNMIRTVGVAFAMRQMRHMESYSAAGRAEIEAIWHQSLATASVCCVLARQYTRINADQALLTGLLHGLGRLYIVMRAEEAHDHENIDISEIATSWHATIGKSILEAWGLPETLQQAVEHQDEVQLHVEYEICLTDILIAAKVLLLHQNDKLAVNADGCPSIQRISAGKHKDLPRALEVHAEEIQAVRLSLGE